jgi:CheY-like chemotaxis protein/anti-sigma regulatory factor (Ser/Thr protein kinase)
MSRRETPRIRGSAVARTGAGKDRILVADDNPSILLGLQRSLTARGYEVRTAGSGLAALHLIEEQSFSLYILDIMMPELSGLELGKHIRRTDAITPIIFITATNDGALPVTALRDGGTDFLTKPFRLDELLARVDSHVRRFQEQRDRPGGKTPQPAFSDRPISVAEREIPDAASAGPPEPITPDQAVIGSIAHALKGEMAAIATGVDMLRIFYRSEELAESLAMIHRSIEFGHLLVENLVAYARIGEQSSGRVDVQSALRSAVQLAGSRLPQGVSLQDNLSGEAGGPWWVRANQQQLISGVVELIQNAATSMADRGGNITLEVEERENWIVIRVADDGPGVPPELRAMLGEKPVTSRRGHGTGLFLLARILRGSGGTLSFDCAPSGGTVVQITLMKHTDHEVD